MSRRFKVGQLAWWGEFICRVEKVSPEGLAIAVTGGPALIPEDEFPADGLRHLGIGGHITVFGDWLMSSPKVPRKIKLLWAHSICGTCGSWTPVVGRCPKCGPFRSGIMETG